VTRAACDEGVCSERMQIYLGGYLTFYSGGERWVQVDLAAPERLKDVLACLNIPAGEVYLTALNGELVDPDEAQVSQSDEVRLYPPVDGGSVDCRPGCGACCIAPSISSPIPGLPQGKPAWVRCVQLTPDNLCRLYGRPERPAICARLKPSPEMCGQTAAEAYAMLAALERATQPASPHPKGEAHDGI
jgi:sulfur carrier protein ThiS